MKYSLETIENTIANDWQAILELASNSSIKALRERLGRNGPLLSAGSAKIDKEDKGRFSTKILYLAPSSMSGVVNLCPAARTCIAPCLNTAGMGIFDNVQQGRIDRTIQLASDTIGFCALLVKEIEAHKRKCEKLGVVAALRLNGTSDIQWGNVWSHAMQLGCKAYEYTKRQELLAWNDRGLSVTLSYQQKSDLPDIQALVAYDHNAAVVFRVKKGQPLPATWQGMRVIDGDITDNRWNDPQGVIVGLRAKGKAKKASDRSQFVVSV